MKRQILISLVILLSIETSALSTEWPVGTRDHPTIQSAISDPAVVNGDVVIVPPGVYSGPGNVDLDFGGKAITVKSGINLASPEPGIIAATIIDCQGTRYNQRRAFRFHSGEGPNSKVLGFTIINGYQRGLAGAAGTPGVLIVPPAMPFPYESIDPDDPNGIPRGERGKNSPVINRDGYGGAILCEGASSPTIQYCVISNCTVTGGQGGDGAPGQWGTWTYQPPYDVTDPNADVPEPVDVDDGQWGGHGGDGSGNGYGGAIACRGGSSPIISDCTISDNFATGGRGGNGGNGGFAAEFPDYEDGLEGAGGDAGASIGDGIGGGIYCEGSSSPTITNCTFSNNIATTGIRGTGGQKGQGNEADPPAPPKGLDSLVTSGGHIAGGAAYYSHPSDPNFTNCTFTGNKAYEAYWFYIPSPGGDISRYTVGGALYSDAFNNVTLDSCKFTGNLGGAVYCENGCNLNFDDCSFTDNSETANGGALYIDHGCTVDLRGCIFGGNSAYDDGGALKCESNITLKNCSFGNNVADSDNDGHGYGGGVDVFRFNVPAPLVIDANACSFSGNQSIYGGGFSSENFQATFTNCYFIDNTAQEGGGLDLVNGDISFTGGAVKANDATDGFGGGFNCRYSTAEIRDCTISDNFVDGVYPAGGSGGAINFYGGPSTKVVFNCLITGNYSAIHGGAIFCLNATPEIGNCTFSGNLAGGFGGAIFSDWSSDPQITDSIFQNNNSHAIHEQNFGGDALVKYSLFYNNPDGDYYDSGTGLTYTGAGEIGSIPDGSNNLYGDPLFVSGPLGGFYLRQQPVQLLPQSPAVDTGNTLAANLGLHTYTTRTDSVGDANQVDRGYHYIDVADAETFQLTTSVVGGQGTIEPETGPYYAGAVVTLTAEPGAGWRVKAWSGTDDDSSTAETSSVVMNSDRTVTVEFEQPRTLIVAVGGGGEGFYINITDALHDAEDGDIIVVYPGVYYGPQVQVNKDVEIRSQHPDDPGWVAQTIIDSTGHAGPVFWFDSARGPGCILNGFTIRNSNWYTATGLDGDDPGENGADGPGAEGGAIWIGPAASPVIKNCVIRDNKILGGFGGDGFDADGTHNAGRGGWGGWARGGAIYCGTNSSPAFINCRIIDNQAVGGLGGDGGDWDPVGGRANYGGNWSRAEWWNIDPRDLTVEWVQGDLWEKWSEMAQPPYGTVQESWYLEDWLTHWGYFGDYRWYSGYGGAVFINRGSNVTFIDCTISGNLAQGGLSGLGGDEPGDGPLRVKPWPRKYEIPSFGGGVYCAADTTVTFNGCTITDNMASDPSYDHTFDAEDHDEADRIEEEYEPDNPYSIDPYLGHGGGVCAEDTAAVIFTDCTFSENEAAVGGAIHFADANPIISDCNFINNSAFHGGGLFGDLGQATIIGCDITNNEAVSDPNVVILGSGGGIHFWATEADIIDCNISSNQAEASGGGVFFGGEGTPLLANCLLTNNTAGRDGGGVSTNIFTQLTISNCTIADNMVTGGGFDTTYGGGLYCSYDSYTNIINSIIWGNLASNGHQLAIGTGFEYDQAPSTVNVSYSAIGPRDAYVGFISDGPFAGDLGQGGGTTLVDGQTIYDQFGAGQERVKVIVSLFEPIEMREATDWDSPESVGILRAEIASRQSSVLSTLTPAEFALRYRYDNQAGFSGEVTIEGLNKLLDNPSVAYIEPVRYVQPALAQAIPLANALEARQVYDGTGIAVAIVDSGVDYTHPRLGNDGFPNNKVIGGYDTGNNDNDPMPFDEAHGTCCAGIAAGDLGMVGDYIGGVAPSAKIYALKMTTDSGLWPTDSAVAAWDWSVTHRNDDPDNPIKVMSNSWYMPLVPFNDPAIADAFSPAHTIAADTAVAASITILAASGNDGFAGQGISWPSAMSNVISVGAVYDTTDAVTGYSNTADNLDILAPADPIYTTDIAGSAGYDVGDYFPYFNGTSAACPFAAGAVASLQSAALTETGSYLTPAQVRGLLVISGDPVTDTKVAITKPRVNLGMAIGYPTAGPIYIEEGSQIEHDWWDPESQTWDPNSHNLGIDEDPNFVAGYYLSQIAAGQSFDSPCVDAGSDLAANLGLDTYTTRTDGVPDGNVQPLVEYLFDTDASDTSGNAYHGIAVGSPVVSGGVLTLDGTSFVDLPASFGAVNPFDGSGDFTLQMDFQINTPNLGTVGDCAGGILISSARDNVPPNHSMSVYVRNWLDPDWSEVVYDNFWVGTVGNEDNPADGAWHNINVAYRATTQQTSIWLDSSNALAWGEPFNPAIPDIALDTVRLGGSLNTEFPYEEVGNLIGSIDNVRIIPDASVIVDMGYHYPLFEPPRYELTVTAIEVSELPEEEQPVVEPNAGFYKWYTKVTLTVTTPVPDGYQVLWSGTDDDGLTGTTNTVTMDSDKVVTVTFVKGAYDLTVEVVGSGGSVSPIGTHTYPRGTVVNLTAYPDEDHRFKQWTGTDNDASTVTTNTVTMFSDRIVTVEFELPATITVPGDYSTIQEAIVAARDRDKIIIASGVYIPTNNGGFIIDKEIMLTSTNPDDPNVVAVTVINPLNRAFTFTTNAGPGAILNGITIADGGFGAIPADDGDDPGENGQDGFGTEGGAIYISIGSSPTIKNCIITGFNLFGGDAGSGADANEGLPGGRGGWAGWARGGGVYVASGSSPTFINCTISNCSATGGNAGDGANGAEGETDDGIPWVQPPGYGGNWSDGILWQLWGYIGDYRYYSAYGGGVYCDVNSTATFKACTITGNSTQGGMSGVGGLTAVTELITNPAISYEIPSYGGGVYCGAGSTVVFEGCTITNNEAPKPSVDEADEVVYHLDPYLGHGGGVAFEKTASVMFKKYVSPITGEERRCVISGNLASVGGGMYWADPCTAPEISDCNFSDNLAYQGGGLFGTNGSAIIENCIIQGNFAGTAPNDVDEVAGQGGGIYSASMAAEIVDCNISDNEAGASGGGMFFTGVAASPIVINCLVTDNEAGRDGGGFSVNWYAEPIIANCTVVGNEATGDFGQVGNTGFGGGLYSSYHSNSEVIDSIFWNNSAMAGDEIAVGTGFEFDPRPATLKVTYSDIRGGRPALLLDTGCTLLWDVDPGDPDYPTNINANPLFATGLAGEYYLSQTDAGQAQTSPCVDTGSDLASNLGMNLYTTRTDEVPDRSIVDMGYHYPLRVELCSFCDLVPVRDGIINFKDYAILALYWRSEGCSDANGWCEGTDLTFDGNVDFDDLAFFVECWLVEDTKAPEPDPSVWKIEPYSTSTTSINMTAETSFDTWWGSDVQYYFESVTDDVNSGWRNEPNWPHTISFDPNAEYGYRVRARDRSSRIPDDGTGEPGNKTGWSAIRYVIPGEAGAAEPPAWVLPYVATPNSITLEVTTSDSNDIAYDQYYFEETSGNPGGSDSSWQSEPNYTDTGLDPDTTYTYRVRARDENGKTTAWSVPLDATTLAEGEVPDTTSPDPYQMEFDPVVIGPYDGFPREIPGPGGPDDYVATMRAIDADDPSGVEYFFECIELGGLSSGWRTIQDYPDELERRTWNVSVGYSGHYYQFRVRARDAASPAPNYTDWSPPDVAEPTG